MQKKILKLFSLWIPPVLWAIMIFHFSSGTIPKASPSFWVDFAIKKIGHIILFATLAVLIYRALVGESVNRKKAAVLAVLISVFYGVTDEYHQMFTQGRESRFRDVVIDGLGASVVICLIYKYIEKLPKSVKDILFKIGIK